MSFEKALVSAKEHHHTPEGMPFSAHFEDRFTDSLPDLPTTKQLSNAFTLSKGPQLSSQRPLRIFYGFGLSYQDLTNYLTRHHLPLPPKTLNRALHQAHLRYRVLDHLCCLCDFYSLQLSPVSDVHANCELVLSLYDSYTITFGELVPEDEEEVLEIIRSALAMTGNVPPQWFYPMAQW
ncbi:hypothetical protein D9757_009362 [Collybiopsis confluens]|uniref:Uncharacterized protein n=1 Tax=Collybiopsis confluens TaxID=2823264 RepID=A0A8H5H6R5_9AGAR|nr:hypothetical protein D9757_009362 [Collybiopsis confluens]